MLSKIPVAIRISVAYLILGTLWIIFSGRIGERLANGDVERMAMIERYKGVFFIVLSTIFLFILSYKLYRRMSRSLEEYRVMEKKNDALVAATKEGIYEYNFREDKVSFNATLRHILGISDPGTIYNARQFWERHIHPDDIKRVLRQFDGAMHAGIAFWREEYRALKENGEILHVLHSLYIMKDDWGKPYGVIGAIQDMTEFRKLETEYHQQELRQKAEISRSIIQAEEKERNRWAEELHDNVAQVLSVASLYAGSLKPDAPDIQQTAEKIREMLDLTVQEIRTLSANLKPPQFEDQSLEEAIGVLTSYIKRLKVLQIDVDVDREICSLLDPDQKLMVYRIIQEQLNNCIKYAEASLVEIKVMAVDGKVCVRVKDNGRGFDASSIREGTGMRNIRSRLELFEGNVRFDSQPGGGCELVAGFPVRYSR